MVKLVKAGGPLDDGTRRDYAATGLMSTNFGAAAEGDVLAVPHRVFVVLARRQPASS